MADEPNEDGAELLKLNSDPPPSGEDLDGPTKVGKISSAVWKSAMPVPTDTRPTPQSILAAADIRETDEAIRARMETETMSPPPSPAMEGGPASGEREQGSPPAVYGEGEGEGENATLLHPAAKRFPLPPPTPPPRLAPTPSIAPAAAPLGSLRPTDLLPTTPDPWSVDSDEDAAESVWERRQTLLVAIAAAVFGVLVAVAIWRWLI
jgi:hypothetical protein